jgi:hypothetical protein
MNELRKVRLALGIFIAGLVVSGLTAFPLQLELDWLAGKFTDSNSGLAQWILRVRDGLTDSYASYPWLAYGTDWLAFGHLVIALFFIAPFIEPIRNVAVVYAGLAACVLTIPLALICGSIRGIPFGWRLIDCSFGILGAIPLWYVLRRIQVMKRTAQ